MRVVMVKPCQYAYITELDEKLESMQAAVGGLIDCVYPWDEKVCIVCNDEAVINGMQANRAMNYYGAIFGPFFVCGIEGNKFIDLRAVFHIMSHPGRGDNVVNGKLRVFLQFCCRCRATRKPAPRRALLPLPVGLPHLLHDFKQPRPSRYPVCL